MVKKGYFGILLSIFIMFGICSCGSSTAEFVSTENTVTETSTECRESLTEMTSPIYVYVCGAVTAPGVYAMAPGSRVCDLFGEAGGLTAEAAKDYWNQARVLVDGEMIYVPTISEANERTQEEWTMAGSPSGTQATEEAKDQKVNINTASKEELMTLPGIGESKALAIIAYREEHGSFSSIEELKEISGIKDGVYSKIEDYIVIN